jgi:hypothetical protein
MGAQVHDSVTRLSAGPKRLASITTGGIWVNGVKGAEGNVDREGCADICYGMAAQYVY